MQFWFYMEDKYNPPPQKKALKTQAPKYDDFWM